MLSKIAAISCPVVNSDECLVFMAVLAGVDTFESLRYST